jgi:hypothetical protein
MPEQTRIQAHGVAGVVLLACACSCAPSAGSRTDQSDEAGRAAEPGDASSTDSSGDDEEPHGDRDGGRDEGDGGPNPGTGHDSDAGAEDPITPLPCDEPFEYQGAHGCLTTVDGTQVKFFPLEEGREVENLAVYLHQDTAWEWFSNDAFPTIVEWARARGIMVVAPLAPEDEDGDPAYGGVGDADSVDRLGALLEKVRDRYGASRDRIYYWGGSGGAWLMAFWFIPQLGHRLPGIFVPSCGGDVSNPYDGWTWDLEDAEARSRIAIYFNYGSEDFLAPYIEDGIEDYRGKGFEVDSLVHQGEPHCVHPIDEPTIEFWSRHQGNG